MPEVMADLIARARGASGPSTAPPSLVRPGSVDPLGLRAINFLLMDRVFPGVNNTATHIRPFVVLAWAWRRAAQLADQQGLTLIEPDRLRDFVDRIEVIYAWSQLMRAGSADLPGREVLEPIIRRGWYAFSGEAWAGLRENRRLSTALMSPINYGPTLRALGWVEPDNARSGALAAPKRVALALDAFETAISPALSHPVFNELGPVEVTGDEVRAWSDMWALEKPTEGERQVMAQLLCGDDADPARRAGVKLMLEASNGVVSDDLELRRSMASHEMASTEARAAWRALQVRQLFRLALEGLFSWSVARAGPPATTEQLVDEFVAGAEAHENARAWLASDDDDVCGFLDRLQRLVWASDPTLPEAIRKALGLCLREAPEQPSQGEAIDRLPIAVAAREAAAFADKPPKAFLGHVFDAWIFGQHVYWSVGRGLADARGGQRQLLRLRVAMDEGGWTRSPGAQPGTANATPDRLSTIVSLARECGLLRASSDDPPGDASYLV